MTRSTPLGRVSWFLVISLVAAACTSSQGIDPPTLPPESSMPDAPATTLGTTTTLTAPPTTPPEEEHWISIEAGTWFDRRTGETFVPRGVNLLRKEFGRGERLFAGYDPAWVSSQLDAIAAQGFNTVRFFLDLCMRCTADDGGVRDDFLDDLTDLLRRIAERGLVALPTSNDVPDPGYSSRLPCCEVFGGYRNSLYLAPEGHDIAEQYFTDLIVGLQQRNAPLHAVLGWQLANEQFYLRDVPPISLSSGSVTTADGRTYDLADDDAVEDMVESNLLTYLTRLGDTIRTLDPGALVTMGFFSAEDPDAGRVASDNRWVVPQIVVHESDLDFVDLHAYPGLGGSWAAIGPAFGLDRAPSMPLLLGEFGAFRAAYDDATAGAAAMARWQAASCSLGFAGWLVWLWGEPTDDEVYTANADGEAIATALSPATRPDPCEVGAYVSANLALDRPTTASQEENEQYAARWATDGSVGTWWSAADGPPQWIEIDLGTELTVGRVEILIGSVSPPGPQTHRVFVRADDEAPPGRMVGEVSADAARGDILAVVFEPALADVRHVRVETIAMDGWVILHEVAVFGP